MKLKLLPHLGGYAAKLLENNGFTDCEVTKPFVLLSGSNGSGKSSIIRGMRASMGLNKERFGTTDCFGRLSDKDKLTPEEAMTQVSKYDGKFQAADHVPAVFSLKDMGWKGQPSYLFDARSVSGKVNMSAFDDHDFMNDVQMIVGGRTKVSHGQFVSRAWWGAIDWAIGITSSDNPWERLPGLKQKTYKKIIGKGAPSGERWLFIDEPETGIDAEVLVTGLSILLSACEVGKLRVFCASHSLLFPAGIADHEKVQTIEVEPTRPWMNTQKIAMKIASNPEKLEEVSRKILVRMTHGKAAAKNNRETSNVDSKRENSRNRTAPDHSGEW